MSPALWVLCSGPELNSPLGSCRRGYQSKKSVLKSLTHNWEQEWAEQVGAATGLSSSHVQVHIKVSETLYLSEQWPLRVSYCCVSALLPPHSLFSEILQPSPVPDWVSHGHRFREEQTSLQAVCLLYLFDELAPGGDCGFRLPNSWCHLKDFWPSSAFLGETFFPQDNSFYTGTTFLCFSPSLKNPHRCPVRPFVQLIYEHLWGLIEKNQKSINTKYLAISWENPIFIITYAWGYTKKSWVVLKSVMQSTIHSSKSVS